MLLTLSVYQSFTKSYPNIQLTVGVTFDQADYNIAENSSLTVTGRLTGLTGELQSNFSLTLSVDFSGDKLTGKPLN